MPKSKPIYVTQPSLPNLEDFIPYLEKIWENKILTNNGPFHQQFEKELSSYLNVNYISLFANGTLALLTALQALKITGEVITTPYSFVATTNALWWNNLKPVFVDVESKYGNLDPEKIEEAITPQTTAILPVHVYGNPCKVERIQEIADTYGLKVIYDAAHCFGNNYKQQSILSFGDLSILSFHATKSFNTFEGGAIVSNDRKMKQRIDYLKNFGFADEVTVMAPGINSKMNELQAAIGILQLKKHNENQLKRNKLGELYKNHFADISGINPIIQNPDIKNHNISYFPILINRKKYGHSRDDLYYYLQKNQIFGRRYFYPLISDFPTYRGLPSAKPNNLKVAKHISECVICLPVFPDMELNEVTRICNLIKGYGK